MILTEIQKKNTQNLSRMWQSEKRLVKLIFQKWPGFISLTIVVSIFIVLIPFASSGLLALIINSLTVPQEELFAQRSFVILISIYGFIIFVRPFFYKFSAHLDKILWLHMEEYFDTLLCKKQTSLDIAHFENPETQDLVQKIKEAAYRVRNFIDRQIPIVQSIIEVVIASIIIATFDWWILPILIVVGIPSLLIELKKGESTWSIHSSNAEIRRNYWEAVHHISEKSSLTELKLFRNNNFFIERIRKLFEIFLVKQEKLETDTLKMLLLTSIPAQLSFVGFIIYLIYSTINGDIQIGTLTFIIATLITFTNAFENIIGTFARQYEDGLFVNDYFKLLDLPDLIEKPTNAIAHDYTKSPHIEFRNVSFTYPGNNVLALENINLTIEPGEKVAIVGINGAGKSTLIKLLCRFYDPTDGDVLINGVSLRELDIESWYRNLSVLFQDYSNYKMLVKELIHLGDTTADLDIERVENASKKSEAHDFVMEWETGYDQMLGNQFTDGVEPSIGQWQKLALSRSFYRNSHVIILDEPTSAIDAEAEAKIFETLETQTQDRSVIFISHRFSTVRKADRIVVLEKNKIHEMGTHEELMKLNGTYARLFQLQAKEYQS